MAMALFLGEISFSNQFPVPKTVNVTDNQSGSQHNDVTQQPEIVLFCQKN